MVKYLLLFSFYNQYGLEFCDKTIVLHSKWSDCNPRTTIRETGANTELLQVIMIIIYTNKVYAEPSIEWRAAEPGPCAFIYTFGVSQLAPYRKYKVALCRYIYLMGIGIRYST